MAERKKLRDITSHLLEEKIVLDNHGNILFMNPEAERLLGWTMMELRNKNVHEVFHCRKADGSSLPFEECYMHNVIKTGIPFVSTDEVFIRKNGTPFPISVITSPIADNDKVNAAVTAFRDMTERKQIENEKEKLISELQGHHIELQMQNEELLNTRQELENEMDRRKNVEAELTLNQAQLRNLYINLQSMREEERANTTREIHDELGQIMAAIKMDVAWLKRNYSDNEGISEKTSSTLHLIDGTIKSVNRICA